MLCPSSIELFVYRFGPRPTSSTAGTTAATIATRRALSFCLLACLFLLTPVQRLLFLFFIAWFGFGIVSKNIFEKCHHIVGIS